MPTPPQDMLDMIGFDDKFAMCWITLSARGLKDKRELEEEILAPHLASYIKHLESFYMNQYGIKFTQEFTQRHLEVVTEAVTNTGLHGCIEVGNNSFSHGSYFGSKGICSAFQDFGGYFGKEGVKALYESSDLKALLDTDYSSFEDAFLDIQPDVNNGTQILMGNTEKNHIDTGNQILYCAQVFKEGDTKQK